MTDTDFERALLALGEQAHASLVYISTHEFRGETVHPVAGTMTLCAALTRLLEGTGFAFDLDSQNRGWIRWVGLAHDKQARQKNAQDGPQLLRVSNPQPEGTALLLTEVTVTGSHIRGMQDITSPLVVIPQRDLDTAPYADVADVMRRVPFSFAGGANQFTDPQGQLGGIPNQIGGQSLNLHGLGVGATLVLLDGYRRPMSGFDGDFVDVSEIPVTAVKQIETLADGASANYGSDAIAGVVNIIMNKDVEGAQTQVRVGTNPGGAREILFAQSLGTHWESGHAMLAYQFSDLRALLAQARFYTASSDKTPLGGSNFSSIRSDPGNILNPSTLQPEYAIPANPTGALLTASQLIPNTVNFQNQLTSLDLTPSRQSNSAFWSASQRLGDVLELFSEGLALQQSASVTGSAPDAVLLVPSSNPFNPLARMSATLVAYSFQDSLGATTLAAQTTSYSGTMGAKVHLPNEWLAALSTSAARETTALHTYNSLNYSALSAALADTNPTTAFDPFGGGTNPHTLDSIKYAALNHNVSTLYAGSLQADGPLLKLPGGEARLAIGAEYRREGLDRDSHTFDRQLSEALGRTVVSAFGEMSIPLVGPADTASTLPRLELSVAARAERYSDFGSTANPKIGVRWSPTPQWRFRGSWGTSFRAPPLIDVYSKIADVAGLVSVPDAASPTGQTVALVEAGHNPNLHQETARSWTAGLDLAPAIVPGLTLSATYYSTHYQNQVYVPQAPLTAAEVLADPRWGQLITRNPSAALIASICNAAYFVGPAAQCTKTVPQVLIDGRPLNTSGTWLRGIDWEIQQSLPVFAGQYHWGIQGAYLLSDERSATALSPAVNVLNTVQNPLSLRFRATTDWVQHGWEAPGFGVGLSMEYATAYRDINFTPARPVGSWTVFDVSASYRTPRWSDATGGYECVLSISNLFNRTPPFVNREIGYDVINAQPYGRVLSVLLKTRW